jgi:uncharacterized protein (DUF305 family)
MSCLHISVVRPSLTAVVLVLTFAVACTKDGQKADTPAVSAASATSTSTSGRTPTDSASRMQGMAGMQGMANMTGDADHDFLRMMSDHHKGLVVLAHMTKDRKDVGSAAADAKKLDAEQDPQLDHMVTMLEKDFKDPYAPKVMPEHQAMADDLKTKSGKDYERTFYQDIIKHHQGAIKMIDDYLPKAKNAMLKQMAEQMKAVQTKQIADYQQKLAKLGA